MSDVVKRIAICDIGLGSIVPAVIRQVLAQFDESKDIEIISLASRLNERQEMFRNNTDWQVASSVRERLLARLDVLGNMEWRGVTAFMDGRFFPQITVLPLFDLARGKEFTGECGTPLIAQNLFLVDHDATEADRLREQVKQVLSSPYVEAQAYSPEGAEMPEPWKPKAFGENQEAAVLSFEHHSNCPWYQGAAGGNTVWLPALKQLVEQGKITSEDIEADITAHRVCPSIGYRVRTGNWDALPSGILDIDAQFAPLPVLNVSTILPLIRTKVFDPPRRVTQKSAADVAAKKLAKIEKDKIKKRQRDLSQEEFLARAHRLLHKTRQRRLSGRNRDNLFQRLSPLISLRLPGILYRAIRNPRAYWERLMGL